MRTPSIRNNLPGLAWSGFAVVLAGSCLLALPLAAAAQMDRAADYLTRMDADRDGRIALPEYQDWLSYAFDAMDRNRDGTLSAGELPGGRGSAVTRAEHLAKLAAAFKRQDGNRDGFLSAKELAAPPQ